MNFTRVWPQQANKLRHFWRTGPIFWVIAKMFYDTQHTSILMITQYFIVHWHAMCQICQQNFSYVFSKLKLNFYLPNFSLFNLLTYFFRVFKFSFPSYNFLAKFFKFILPYFFDQRHETYFSSITWPQDCAIFTCFDYK